MKKIIISFAFFIGLTNAYCQTLNFINKADKPLSRSASSCASNGQNLFICNGFSATSLITSEIEKYNFETNSWSILPTLAPTISKKYGSAETLSNKLYLFNGETTLGSSNDKLEILNLDSGSLTISANLNPNPVINGGSSVLGDYFLVFGGCINRFNASYSNKLYELSPFGTWQQLADMPVALETKGKAIYGNGNNSKLYVFGGYNETNSIAENFETVTITGNLSLTNWANIAEVGNKFFQGKSFEGNKYAQFSAFGSVVANQEPTNITWLISDEVTVTSTDNVFLNFDTKDGFNNGALLEAYIITNWTGNITTSTKTLLDATISNAGGAKSYATNFTNSGTIALNSFPNNFRIAFKYTGGYAPIQKTTVFQIDNVRVYKGFSSNAIYIYDVASNSWSTSSTVLPEPISAHAVTVDNPFNGNKIYVTGDYNNQTFVGVYNTINNNFTTLSQTNMIGRRHHNSEIWDNKLYLFGGNTTPSSSSVLASTQSADIVPLSNENFNSNQEFAFYPNPTNEKIILLQNIIDATIFSLDGKKINTELLNHEINVSNIKNGIYIIKLLSENGDKIYKKLIKK